MLKPRAWSKKFSNYVASVDYDITIFALGFGAMFEPGEDLKFYLGIAIGPLEFSFSKL